MPDELESDIQATAEDIVADAESLQAVEAEKLTLGPSHPRSAGLAARAEGLARRILGKTVAERELVGEATQAPDPPDAADS